MKIAEGLIGHVVICKRGTGTKEDPTETKEWDGNGWVSEGKLYKTKGWALKAARKAYPRWVDGKITIETF